MNELENMVEDIKKQYAVSYTIYKRSLPIGPQAINRVIAQNIESYEAGIKFCKTMKLESKLVNNEDGSTSVVYYDVLPDNIPLKDVFHNDNKHTTVGNNKKKAAEAYFDL